MAELDKNLLYYLCGPMTGYPHHNYPEFMSKSQYLRELGYMIVNPAELHPQPKEDYTEEYWISVLKRDLSALLACEGLILLDGWEKSRGATLEHYVAKSLSYNVLNIRECLKNEDN